MHATGSAAGTTAAEIGEIVVTARKRSEFLQKIPETITAIDGAVLARQGVKDLFQAITLVPDAVFSRAPDDGLALTYRGLGTAARPQAFDQSVALFTDGVFNGKGRLYTASFFDVDRLEFVKGSQSTLLGKNASLGAISVISRQPGDSPSFEARGAYEVADGGYSWDAAADQPLSDKMFLRMAVHYNDFNGWIHNDVTGNDDPEHQDLGIRAILRADLSETLRITTVYQYGDNRQVGTNFQLIGDIPAAYGPGVLGGDVRQFTSLTPSGDTVHNTRSNIAYTKAEWSLGDAKLVSQTAFVNYNTNNIDNMGFNKDNSVNFTRTEHYNQATEEIRFESGLSRKLEYMGGIFFLWSYWDSLEGQLWAVPDFPPPPAPASGQLFNGPFYNHFVQTSYAYSGFVSGTYHFSESLRLSGGARYTNEQKDVVYGRAAAAPFTIWNQLANPPFDPTPLTHRSNFLDGDVSLQYDLARDVMAYVSFAHGSKSGGFVETNSIAVSPALLVNGLVPPALVASGAAIKDESTRSYEVGLKAMVFDHRLRLALDGFWTDVENFQDTVFTGGPLGFITFNGPAQSKGVELDGAFAPTSGLVLRGALTYADATGVIQPIGPSGTPEVGPNGSPILQTFQRSQAPRVIANVSVDYVYPITNDLEVLFGATSRYRGMMFNQRQEEFPSAPLTTLDISIGLESRKKTWSLDLIAKNVTNARSQDFASPSVDPRFSAFYGAYLAGSNPGPTVMISAHVNY